MTNDTEFFPGSSACVVVRSGRFSFSVFPAAGGGSHVLELCDVGGYAAFLDGDPVCLDGHLGLWDLLDLPVGGSRSFDEE